jgi:hypothetical protein
MVSVIVKDSLVYGVGDREKKTIYVIGQISMVLTHFKTMVGSCLPAVVNRRNNVLFTLFVFACVYFSSTHTVLGFCFAFLRLVCPMLPVSLCFCFAFLRLVYPMLPVSLCFCFAFLRLVYPMLPVFLDFPFVIAFSVFSNVYSKIFAENAATINYE